LSPFFICSHYILTEQNLQVEYNNFLDFFRAVARKPHLTRVEQCDKIDKNLVVSSIFTGNILPLNVDKNLVV